MGAEDDVDSGGEKSKKECWRCGSTVSEKHKYCIFCGALLFGADAKARIFNGKPLVLPRRLWCEYCQKYRNVGKLQRLATAFKGDRKVSPVLHCFKCGRVLNTAFDPGV